MEFIIWFAQAKGVKPGAIGMLVQFAPFIIIFALFWFLIIRPQRKRESAHQDMLGMLKKGDKIVTGSGIFGEIVSITPETALIEISPRVKVTFQRSAISGMVSSEQYSAIQQKNSAPVSHDKPSRSLKKKKK